MGCIEAGVSTPPKSAVIPKEPSMATLNSRLELSMKTGVPVAIAQLGGTATLVEASQDFIIHEDGSSSEITDGLLRLERGSVVQEVRFVSGRPMNHWGHPMAVFGERSLYLYIYPPGSTVTP